MNGQDGRKGWELGGRRWVEGGGWKEVGGGGEDAAAGLIGSWAMLMVSWSVPCCGAERPPAPSIVNWRHDRYLDRHRGPLIAFHDALRR